MLVHAKQMPAFLIVDGWRESMERSQCYKAHFKATVQPMTLLHNHVEDVIDYL
jgi:hypothetical protein